MAGACYWNVAEWVRREGGRVLFGWMIVELPALALVAWHHAVWQRPDGETLDLSLHPLTGRSVGTTLFVEDLEQGYDLAWPPAMSQRFLPLIDDPRLTAFVEAYERHFALMAEALDEQRRARGATYDWRTATLSAPDDAASRWLRDVADRYDPLLREADRLRRALLIGIVDAQRERSEDVAR